LLTKAFDNNTPEAWLRSTCPGLTVAAEGAVDPALPRTA